MVIIIKNIKISSVAVKHTSVLSLPDDAKTVQTMLDIIKNNITNVLPEKPDFIILPEYCDIPDNYDNSQKRVYCNTRGNIILDALKQTAKENQCYIAFNTIREDNEKHYNSTILIGKRGDVEFVYDKNYPYLPEMDDGLIIPGKTATVYKCELGRIAFATCFDLNIDSLWNQYNHQKPDIIVFCSMFHGSFMQQMRAFQARAHFVSSISYPAPSCVLSPVGKILAQDTNYLNYFTYTVNIDCAVFHLDFNIDKFGAIKQKYGNKVKIDDPGYLGSAVIYSQSDEFSIYDIQKEFNLETLDEYLVRCESTVNDYK